MINLTDSWRAEILEGSYSPPQHNRPTLLGYDCIRRLYFERMNPEQKAPLPFIALQKMREGKEQEKTVRRHLMDLGYDIIRTDEPFEIKEFDIAGRWDCFIKKGKDDPILCEFKTTEPYTFAKMNSIEDFKSNKWWSRYLTQVTVYMKAAGVNKILFIVKDRTKWDIKEFEYGFDEKLWELTSQKCLILNKFIEAKKITFFDEILCAEYQECDQCPFYTFCAPKRTIISEGYERIEDSELVDILNRREKLKPLAKEYETLDSEVKETFKGRNAFIGTDYELVSKLISKNGNPNPKPIEPSKYWRLTINKLKGGGVDDKNE